MFTAKTPHEKFEAAKRFGSEQIELHKKTHDVSEARKLLAQLERLAPSGFASIFARGDIAKSSQAEAERVAVKLLKASLFSASTVNMASGQSSDPLEPKPITIVASSGCESYQGYWGRCVFDMNGFQPPSGPVPLDFNHDASDVVGVADSVSVVNGQLVAAGRLTPFKPDDSASEIIAKGLQGVPYQASIVLDLPTLQVQTVEDGQALMVNGVPFMGPGAVFRSWTVNGIAITPYGADSKTSVQFTGTKPIRRPQIAATVRI